jgi:transposase
MALEDQGHNGVSRWSDGQVSNGAAIMEAGRRPPLPDPEVPAKASRRRFTAAYKRRILEQAEQCAPGELGALLRREGLYSSHLTKWRAQRAAGRLQGRKKTAGKAELDAALKRVAAVERENRRLRQRLERAETIISVQKKLSSLLGLGPQDEGRN